MFFRQILHDDLGCASYVVADGGEAVVVDPRWEIDAYLELAAEHGFRIAHVVETHNHADHVSGRGRLIAATGAVAHVSERAGAEYEHEPLSDGQELRIGGVRLRALAMPGHRPEHTALLVSDDARSEEPWLLLSGDSVFVGDLARPDLAVEPREGARELHASLRRLDALDGGVEVWPGHIGGSLCGGAGMSEKPSSTLAYERRANELLGLRDRAGFVERVTRHLAPQPPNFRRIVELNRGPLVTQAAPLPGLGPERVAELLGDGAILLDGRAPRAWDAEHVPGSLSVTMVHAAVGTRAAWVVDPLAHVVVTAASDADARRMARMLEAVGFRRLEGYLAGGLDAWRDAGLATESTPAIDVAGLAARLRAGEVRLLDVREDDEWREGHVAGSEHLPYHELRDGPAGAAAGDGRPLAVACSAGNRAALAVSLLRRHGVDGVIHVAGGGIADLADHGIELTPPEAA